MLAKAREVADAPLPAPEACGEDHLRQVLRTLLAVLPKRGSDEVSGALLIEAYQAKLLVYPKDQISYLGDRAMERCQWFPTIAECREIMQGWRRDDDHVRRQQRASLAVRRECEARFDELMTRLACGQCDQAEIDGLPERTRRIAEERGFLRRHEDGSYSARRPAAGIEAREGHDPQGHGSREPGPEGSRHEDSSTTRRKGG